MTATDRILISDPDDVVGIVPYLLGFQPDESLVLIWLRHGRVELTARFDLAAVSHPGYLADSIAAQRMRLPHADVIAVAYGSDEVQARSALADVVDLCGARVLDALHATSTHWWSLLCAEHDGCPPEGHELEFASDIAAEAVFAGICPLSSRRELKEFVRLPEDSDHYEDAFATAIAQYSRIHSSAKVQLVRAMIEEYLTDPGPLTTSEAAGLAVLIKDPAARDVATLAIRAENAQRMVELWRSVVAQCIPLFAVAPLGEMGLAAWVHGDGALMVEALDAARELDPQHGLVAILDDLYANIVPPSVWEQLRQSMAG